MANFKGNFGMFPDERAGSLKVKNKEIFDFNEKAKGLSV